MESTKKRKLREKAFTKDQLLRFKALRKEQKKKRKRRKNKPEEQPKKPEEQSKVDKMAAQLPPANVRSSVKKRELEDQEKYLPIGKRMVNASLKAVNKKGEKDAAAPKALRPEVRESRKL